MFSEEGYSHEEMRRKSSGKLNKTCISKLQKKYKDTQHYKTEYIKVGKSV